MRKTAPYARSFDGIEPTGSPVDLSSVAVTVASHASQSQEVQSDRARAERMKAPGQAAGKRAPQGQSAEAAGSESAVNIDPGSTYVYGPEWELTAPTQATVRDAEASAAARAGNGAQAGLVDDVRGRIVGAGSRCNGEATSGSDSTVQDPAAESVDGGTRPSVRRTRA